MPQVGSLEAVSTVSLARSLVSAAALATALAACGTEPDVLELVDPGDTAQSRGTLLASGVSRMIRDLVWVPGTELVAFARTATTGEGCAIETVDATSRVVSQLDGDCGTPGLFEELYFRGLVAAPGGSALYYTAGVGDWRSPERRLHVADPVGGGTRTLRNGVGPLAVSPDGRHLAFVASGGSPETDSLIVRDLSSGAERHYADYDGRKGMDGGPVAFSPDGGELLYGQWTSLVGVSLRRVSLGSGAGQTVTLPAGVFPQLLDWDASGIRALVNHGSSWHVLNLTTGGSVEVGSLQNGEGRPYEGWQIGAESWSADGTRVAYWIGRCFSWRAMFDCGVARYALLVADTRTGTRVRVAYTSLEPGRSVFSPDNRRIAYRNYDADALYVVDVP